MLRAAQRARTFAALSMLAARRLPALLGCSTCALAFQRPLIGLVCGGAVAGVGAVGPEAAGEFRYVIESGHGLNARASFRTATAVRKLQETPGKPRQRRRRPRFGTGRGVAGLASPVDDAVSVSTTSEEGDERGDDHDEDEDEHDDHETGRRSARRARPRDASAVCGVLRLEFSAPAALDEEMLAFLVRQIGEALNSVALEELKDETRDTGACSTSPKQITRDSVSAVFAG